MRWKQKQLFFLFFLSTLKHITTRNASHVVPFACSYFKSFTWNMWPIYFEIGVRIEVDHSIQLSTVGWSWHFDILWKRSIRRRETNIHLTWIGKEFTHFLYIAFTCRSIHFSLPCVWALKVKKRTQIHLMNKLNHLKGLLCYP